MSELYRALRDEIGVERDLSEFDLYAIGIVAGLIERVDRAAQDIADNGSVINGRENPSCLTERTASAEIRGWVQSRPDLFGERKGSGKAVASVSKLSRFKTV